MPICVPNIKNKKIVDYTEKSEEESQLTSKSSKLTKNYIGAQY
jgi:hypothetical protein